MKTNLPPPPSLESRILPVMLVGFATLIGGFVRFIGQLAVDFPLNDGGLFHVMIQALQANHYSLPVNFQYNGLLIPFAYPPLGFYITGLTSDLLHQSLLDVMRWLPPLVCTFTIPAFYFLARSLIPSRMTAILGTFAFALLPRSFDWLIMGGGVTRSFGFLFAILTLVCIQDLFTNSKPRKIIWTSILGSLTILTHPEAAVHTAFAALLLLIFHGRNRDGFLQALWSAIITILLTAPWWITMLARHGIEPYLAAAQSSRDNYTGLVNLVMRLVLLFKFEFTDEVYLPLLTVFGFIGMFMALGRKKWFLPVWLITSLLLEPRSAPLYMILPLSLLSAQALTDIILPALQSTGAKYISPIFLGLLLAYSMTSAISISNKVAKEITLQPTERKAMEWINGNTPVNGIFLVLTDRLPLRDPVSEWFPVLADRISAATVYGSEWISDPPFSSRVDAYQSLQACISRDLDCIQNWGMENGIPYTHVMISMSGTVPLQVYLDASDNYALVYRSPGVSIYQKK